MPNPLKGSNKKSKTSTSLGGKTKIHNNMDEHMKKLYKRKKKTRMEARRRLTKIINTFQFRDQNSHKVCVYL